MYNIKLTNYIPEPNPVSSEYIVAAHYYAAWKKGSAGLHNAFDDLHEYPERTPLMGYYDEENPKVADWEIKWAIEHGFKYLQAIREELTERDNLPDYRTPQDIGLSDFNKSWGKPDLSEICKKKFNLE